jgi:hypothetical protein
LLSSEPVVASECKASRKLKSATLATVEDHDHAETWRQSVRRVQVEDMRARNASSLDTPMSMLPPPNGRKIRVARNPTKRQWMLAIGPTISQAKLKEKEQAARATATVSDLEQERSELLERAAALEAEALALRKDAGAVAALIGAEVKRAIGPVLPFTETYDFQADEATDADLAVLPQDQLVNRLLSARGKVTDSLEEIGRGYWGDMRFMSSQQIRPGPEGPRTCGWTNVGSPEWLDELFPNWNEPGDAKSDSVEQAAGVAP